MNINECLEKGYLEKIIPQEDLIKKEIEECDYDFSKAKKSLGEEDYKWSIVMSYYTIFHAAKALLFKLGYREKKHFAILVVLKELNKRGKLENKYVNYFNAAISSREDADYHYIYSIRIAEDNLRIAKEFKEKIKELIKNEL